MKTRPEYREATEEGKPKNMMVGRSLVKCGRRIPPIRKTIRGDGKEADETHRLYLISLSSVFAIRVFNARILPERVLPHLPEIAFRLLCSVEQRQSLFSIAKNNNVLLLESERSHWCGLVP